MKYIGIVTIFMLLLGISSVTIGAESIAVIVNKNSGLTAISKEQMIDIFMGRIRQLPSGVKAVPIDLDEIDVKSDFYQQLIGKSLAEVNAYWARLLFTGRVSPPRSASSIADMQALVSGIDGGIGYAYTDNITESPHFSVLLVFNK